MRGNPMRILAGAGLAVLTFSSVADAAIIYATDFGQLSTAIDTANGNPGADTIYLAPGEYSGGSLPNILDSLTLALDPASGAAPGSAILNTAPTGEKGILTIPFGVT